MDEVLRAKVAAVLLLVCAPSGVLALRLDQAPAVEDAASWAQAQYDRALELALPFTGEAPRSTEWVLDARTLDVRKGESLLHLEVPYAGSPTARVTEINEPLITQLERVRANSPTISLDNAIGHLKVQRRVVTAEECPGIRSVARDLLRLKAPLRMPNALVMDGAVLQFRLRGQYSDSIDIRLADADPSYPLATWLREAWTVIRGCSGQKTVP